MVVWGRTATTDRPIVYEGPPMQEAIDYAFKRCAYMVTRMQDETKEQLAAVISQAVEEKWDIPKLSREIRGQFDDMSKYRSQMIARTETCDALEQAFIDRSKALGVTGKRWIVTEPCPICEDCGDLGAVPLDFDYAAAVKDYKGIDPQRPPAHPNCRCALAPVMLELEEADRDYERDERGRFATTGGAAVAAEEPPQRSAASRARAERARASHKPSTGDKQAIAERNELRVAEAAKGDHLPDNEPFDVVKGDHAVEVKTIMKGADSVKVTMHKDSLARKVAQVAETGLRPHTVVVDERTAKVYYKEGLGSFRLSTMQEVSWQDLDKLIG